MFKKLKQFFNSDTDTEQSQNTDKTASDISQEDLREQIVAALKTVYDPEIPLDIYELGLIYGFDIDDDRNVTIQMTLTTPGCPVAETFPGTVETAVKETAAVNNATVELVWEPPWTMDRMSDAAKLQLNLL